jgi:hypothetical protein
MKFNYGVEAKLVFTKDTKYAYYYNENYDLYEKLEPIVGHDAAEDAMCWAEMACIGMDYEHEKFTIEMVEVL